MITETTGVIILIVVYSIVIGVAIWCCRKMLKDAN